MQIASESLTQQLELADALLAGRDRMLEPQDLPGRYGRVVRAIDQVLRACDCEAVVGGGWEGGRPGTASRPARTTIPHPRALGAVRGHLKYISLVALIELKLAAGRLRDEADVIELARENRDQLDEVRRHLEKVHLQYAARFEELLTQLDDPGQG
jgi:hypothetical protein